VFRNNRNKQKTNQYSIKFVKISTFLIPHTISSVYFGCFDTSPKHRNKPKEKIFGFAKKPPKNNRNKLSFSLFRFKPRKKMYGFKDPLIEKVFWRFFSICFNKILFVSVVDTSPKHQNKRKKMFFGFSKQIKKQPKQIEFQFVSV
jgi:hypothetical protein